jgi:hypothetical protein
MGGSSAFDSIDGLLERPKAKGFLLLSVQAKGVWLMVWNVKIGTLGHISIMGSHLALFPKFGRQLWAKYFFLGHC